MLSAAEIRKRKSEPLVMATAYDFPFAKIVEEAGADIVLVGDSLANVVLGLAETKLVGMDEMAIFVAAAARGAPNTHVTADMPFGSDQSVVSAIVNARRFMDAGAASVKLEGPKFNIVRALVEAGIPVMGHLGVLPQTAESFRPVGKSGQDRERLLSEAAGLEAAGAFCFVLENVEAETARAISESVSIPTIGIGSGKGVNGQVQVLHDLLGLSLTPPPFAQVFASVREEALRGLKAYTEAVRGGKFPR